VREVRAKVFYDPEAAALYIQLSEMKAASTLRLPQVCKGDIYWINADFDESGAVCGIEVLLNPDSRLKQVLDECLREVGEG